MRARDLAAIIAVAAVIAATILVTLGLGGELSNGVLGASGAFEQSLADGCAARSGPEELWTDLAPLNVTTVIDLPGATAVATQGGVAYVGTRAGTVIEWSLDDETARPFLDLSDNTAVSSDQGLLNLAVTPDGKALLVMRTVASGDLVITAHLLDGSGERPIELLRISQPDPRHNGGGLAFGPDGDLFIGIGDGGGQGDPSGNASDPSNPLGSILRATVDLDRGILEPAASDRAVNEARHDLVWAVGLRNPFRIWFDDVGKLWVGDVGERCREEVTVLELDDPAPDLGWSAFEGSAIFDGGRVGGRTVTAPLVEYSHEGGACAVVGGTEYEGDIDDLNGAQIIADVCSGQVMAIIDGELIPIPVQFAAPVDLGIGPDKQLWIADMTVGVRRVTNQVGR